MNSPRRSVLVVSLRLMPSMNSMVTTTLATGLPSGVDDLALDEARLRRGGAASASITAAARTWESVR